MSNYSDYLVDYYHSLQDVLCDQSLIDTCSGTKETTPTLSGTTTSGVSNVEITNYDLGNFYAETVSSGTASRTDNTITWDSNSQGTLTVYAASEGFVLSDPGIWTVGIYTFINGKPWKNQYDINTADDTIGTWTAQTTFLTAYSASSQAIVTDSRVYLLGGYDNVPNCIDGVITAPINSDGTLGTWTAGTSLPGVLAASQAIVTNNRVYLLGGKITDTNFVSTVYTAPINPDGTLGTWTTGTSLPGVLGHSQAIVTNNRVYLLGGRTPTYVSTVYTAPINNNGTLGTWTTGTSLPGNLANSQAIVTNNRVYLLGGFSSSTVYTAPINSDGTLGTWTTGTSLSENLAFSQAIVTNDRIYLLGGLEGSSYSKKIYTAPVNTDGTLGTLVSAGYLATDLGQGQAIVTNSMVYLLGGYNGNGWSAFGMTAPFDGGYNNYMDKSID